MRHTAYVLGLSNAGLAAVRSLGRRNIPVVGVDWRARNVGCVSRYCVFRRCPDPAAGPERVAEFLVEEGRRLAAPGILMQACDEMAQLVSRYREALLPYFRVVLPEAETVEATVDKLRQCELARKLGIACPETVLVERLEDAARVQETLPYPVLIKPVHSHLWRKHFPFKVFQARGPEELMGRCRQALEAGLKIVVQSEVLGPDTNLRTLCAYINQAGRVLGACVVQKLRQFPIRYGEATLAVTVEDPEITELGFRYALGIGFRGACMVEFKQDKRDGQWKLMELNPRYWSHAQLAVDAGVDLPWLHYADLAGEDPEPQMGFRAGVKWWYSLRDLRSFWGYRKRGQLTLWQWLASLRGVSSYSAFAWDDLRPFLRQSAMIWRVIRGKLSVA